MNSTSKSRPPKIGLVLSGGGARGAYQAGVVKAISEITHDLGLPHPTPIVTGVSAGAINAAFIAAHADNFVLCGERLAAAWSSITADRIFRTDALTAGRSGLRFLTDAAIGAFYRKKLARSLLDTSPLGGFLNEYVPFERIDENLANGSLQALAITAMNYTRSTSVSFIHGRSDNGMWERSRRTSEPAKITASHVMASSAIPLFFPPVAVGSDHYGDGCLRNTAPLSPAVHLGADRLLVIGVRKPDSVSANVGPDIEPSLARVLGVMLNALLLDAIDVDMERLSRINSTIDLIPPTERETYSLHKIDYLWLRPSEDIGLLAGQLFDRLPSVIKYLVGGLGSSKEAAELTSYLLFDPDFCGQLVRSGYEDGMANKAAITAFCLP